MTAPSSDIDISDIRFLGGSIDVLCLLQAQARRRYRWLSTQFFIKEEENDKDLLKQKTVELVCLISKNKFQGFESLGAMYAELCQTHTGREETYWCSPTLLVELVKNCASCNELLGVDKDALAAFQVSKLFPPLPRRP